MNHTSRLSFPIASGIMLVMQAGRYSFTVDRRGDQAAITLNCGGGVYRCRLLSLAMLEHLIGICDEIRRKTIPSVCRRRGFVRGIPTYPQSVPIAASRVPGACEIRVVASSNGETGRAEFCTAFYDEGQVDAPVLVLLDEQLDEFIERASRVALTEEF